MSHWNSASRFPTPGTPLLVETADGTQYYAIRKHYVKSYNSDPQYTEIDTNLPITGVIKWQIQSKPMTY